MNRPLRVVLGPDRVIPGAHESFALKVADAARAAGLAVRGIQISRIADSVSRYVQLGDGAGRLWIIRISNYRRPHDADHALPHLDIVTRDGVAGFSQAAFFIGQIVAGLAHWFDPNDYRRPKRRRG